MRDSPLSELITGIAVDARRVVTGPACRAYPLGGSGSFWLEW